MSRTPGPLFVDIANSHLRAYWEGRRDPTSSSPDVRNGMYLDNDRVPVTPEVYRTRVEELIPLWAPNSWENFADVVLVINNVVGTYSQYYKAAIHSPLNTTASPEVRAWYDGERAKLGLPPAPPRQVDTQGNPV